MSMTECDKCGHPYGFGCFCGVVKSETELLKEENANLHEQLVEANTRLSGQTCFVPPEFQAELDECKAKLEALAPTLNTLIAKNMTIDTTAVADEKNSILRAVVDSLANLDAAAPKPE